MLYTISSKTASCVFDFLFDFPSVSNLVRIANCLEAFDGYDVDIDAEALYLVIDGEQVDWDDLQAAAEVAEGESLRDLFDQADNIDTDYDEEPVVEEPAVEEPAEETPEEFNPANIKRYYLGAMKKLHPDVNNHPEATRLVQVLNTWYHDNKNPWVCYQFYINGLKVLRDF